MIYHDLRSPLGNIVSSLGVLQSIVGDEPSAAAILKVASHSTDRIQRLVDSLLDINRLESGQSIANKSEARAEVGEVVGGGVLGDAEARDDGPDAVPGIGAAEGRGVGVAHPGSPRKDARSERCSPSPP